MAETALCNGKNHNNTAQDSTPQQHIFEGWLQTGILGDITDQQHLFHLRKDQAGDRRLWQINPSTGRKYRFNFEGLNHLSPFGLTL
jgi:hypothetical protein